MKITRKFAFRATALLMLTMLAIMPMVPAGASPDWGWIPGKVTNHAQEGSHRNISICTAPFDSVVTNRTSSYGCQQGSDMEFSSVWGPGLVNITVPKNSFHSDPFFLKTTFIPPANYLQLWCQVYLVDDGNGTLDTVGGNLDVAPISINVTGHGDGTAGTPTVQIGDDVNEAQAGSAILFMPLNMSVYVGESNTSLGQSPELLMIMQFPMYMTTGFAEARIIDTAGPYPSGSVSMDGYYKNVTGVPFDAHTGAVTLVAAGPLLDVYALLMGMADSYTDNIFTDFEVLAVEKVIPVGGVWVPVDKLALLAPYVAIASTIILAVVATAIFSKYRKKP